MYERRGGARHQYGVALFFMFSCGLSFYLFLPHKLYNPESPQHWFYREWILKAREKNALHLHFTMEDNPALSEAVKRRYRTTYSGAFYRRFVLGEWTRAQGLVYDFFDRERDCAAPVDEPCEAYAVSVDYGTANPASFGLWGRRGQYGTASTNTTTLPAGKGNKNRCGICGRIMAPAGWAQAGRSGCGSVGGQLYRSFAAHGFAGAESGQRRAVGHPCDSGDAQREKTHSLQQLRRLFAGDGTVLLGRGGSAGRSPQGA